MKQKQPPFYYFSWFGPPQIGYAFNRDGATIENEYRRDLDLFLLQKNDHETEGAL